MTATEFSRNSISLETLAILKKVLDELVIPVVELDLNYRMVYANRAAKDLLGFSDASIANGIFVSDIVVHEQLGLVTKGLELVRNGASPAPLALRTLRVDGVQVPVQTFTDTIHNSTGAVVGFLIYVFDMTRQTRIEEKLEDQHEAFKIIVEQSQLGILVVDDNYRFVYVNDGLCTMLGRQRNEILGHDFREFLHPDSIALVTERYIKRQRGEKVPSIYKFKVIHSSGAVKTVLINTSTMVASDGTMRTVAQLHDFTELEEQRIQLEASEQRYRTLVETMQTGLGIDDVNGLLIYVNPALVKMLGYADADEIIGRPLSDIMAGLSQEIIEKRIEMRKQGSVESYEAQLIHRSGRLIPVVVNASPLFGPDGEYIGSFGLITDVSNLKQAEAEAHFLLDLLLHDFGNQLQLVIAGAELCHPNSSIEILDAARGYILDGARRCLELISKVRKIEAAKGEVVRPIELVDILLSEIEHMSRQYGISPVVEGIPGSITVYADSSLSNLFWNIMENAIKHNKREEKKLWIAGRLTDDTFYIEFADNGPGLSDSKKAEIFLSTRRYGGVGLHIVKTLATKYGIRIMVDDRVQGHPDQGLKVTLAFSLAK